MIKHLTFSGRARSPRNSGIHASESGTPPARRPLSSRSRLPLEPINTTLPVARTHPPHSALALPPIIYRLRLLGLAALNLVQAAPLNEVYKLGPDSQTQPNVPAGRVTPWAQLPGQAYSGTLHDYGVYVPAQYDAATPAALMVFQDGQAFCAERVITAYPQFSII